MILHIMMSRVSSFFFPSRSSRFNEVVDEVFNPIMKRNSAYVKSILDRKFSHVHLWFRLLFCPPVPVTVGERAFKWCIALLTACMHLSSRELVNFMWYCWIAALYIFYRTYHGAQQRNTWLRLLFCPSEPVMDVSFHAMCDLQPFPPRIVVIFSLVMLFTD